MVAEEESHMKSEAMLLSLEWRFSRGRFITPALLGYDRVEVPDGHGSHKKVLQINEDEAQTVRLMYYMLLNGSNITDIASTLTELERETGQRKVNGKPNTHWSEGGVYKVLRNERYCGDVLARKPGRRTSTIISPSGTTARRTNTTNPDTMTRLSPAPSGMQRSVS